MDLLEQSMIKQMDLMSMQLPPEIPQPPLEDLDTLISSNCPAKFSNAAKSLGLDFSEGEIIRELIDYKVQVAVTPLGNADAPLGDQFVQPCQVEMTVRELLESLGSKDRVYYMQSQDDNLNKEFSTCELIPRDLMALKKRCYLLAKAGPPEAANLWIGGPKTKSRLHNDNYDNIFVQLSGRKRIYLIPPSHVYGVHEKFLIPKRYNFNGELLDDEETASRVLFPTVDPSNPPQGDTAFSATKVYCVDLDSGDALFIPALWYHQVEILGSDVNVSVNYWYSPSAHSALWPMWDFFRSSSLQIRGQYDDMYFS